MYNFNELDIKLEETSEHFLSELRSIQTGRATPMVLDNVMVMAYGSLMNLAHAASVNIEDAKTLLVSPFDKSLIREIEKSINDADLGLSVTSHSDLLRVTFPVLTTERREQYVKLAKEKLEDSRIRVRQIREEIKKSIEQKGKDGEFGEDDKKRLLEMLQDKIDKSNSNLEDSFYKKQKEIMGN